MTKHTKATEQAKALIENWLIQRGYIKDAWGHYSKPCGTRRYKFGQRDLRVERIYRDSEGKKNYIRIALGSYKSLYINNEDKLAGLKR